MQHGTSKSAYKTARGRYFRDEAVIDTSWCRRRTHKSSAFHSGRIRSVEKRAWVKEAQDEIKED